ncbi:LysR family transcriptional regulator [Croceicoccus estronivorus]|uniref:LysR family transcriptional regulator n=1 Tax=Croceicoccus estronivorus TaxID=1172626 RepID=UPI000832BF6E|nr:LysR family transcriptional regulator [Croceicoccus estronivorus]OCC22720.1 LysR family transcriptional regulator [Croceicoccus estronivorus]
MTLDQLRIFVAVAEALSMTRAAERLNLTQPAVSAAVAALEERHDTRLFDRVGRRLELTEAGKLFLPEAREVLARAEAAQRVLVDLADLTRGEVRIAASQTVANYWLPERMARFAGDNPGIRLDLVTGNTAQAVARVLGGEADLGFVEGFVDEPILARRVVGHDRIGLYVAPGHRLAGCKVSKADLETTSWALREPGSGTRESMMAGLAKLGIAEDTLDIRMEFPSNDALLEAARAGDLIAGVSDMAAAPRVAAGLIQRLDCPLAERDFTMVTHRARRLGRAAAAFMASL